MKLTEELKNRIDGYFENIDDQELYNKLVKEYGAIVEDLKDKEMELTELIQLQIKEAMKNREKTRLEALRSVKTEMMVELTAPGAPKELSDDDVLKIIRKLVKQREDSISQYKAAGRDDLAENETNEMEVLKKFLPLDLTEQEIVSIIKEQIDKHCIERIMKNMGRLMGLVNSEVKGRADGKLVADLVKKELMG